MTLVTSFLTAIVFAKVIIILSENKEAYDKMFFSGDKMKKQYLIYANELHRKGKYFSNFYGEAFVELEKISNKLNLKKEELGLFQEVK